MKTWIRQPAHLLALAAILAVVGLAGPAQALPDGIQVEEYVTGLTFPVALEPIGNGDILAIEKLGTLRLVRNGQVVDEPLASFEVLAGEEAGLVGLGVPPDFAERREVVVSMTPADDKSVIRLARVRVNADGTGEVVDPAWMELPSRADTDRHYSGTINFTDTHMFVSLGELDDRQRAQDHTVLSGSLLRYNLDGTIPADNPWPDSPVYAIGFRNPFGFDIAADGTVWLSDNGHHLHDEVNRVEPGENYGWPLVMGYCDNYPLNESCDEADGLTDPMFEFQFQVGPTGVVYYEAALMEELQGGVFVGGWHTAELYHFTPSADGERLIDNGPFFIVPGGGHSHDDGGDHSHAHGFGIVDAAVAHDGALLVLVSGMDRGDIYRIAPEAFIINPSKVVEPETVRAERDPPVCQVGALERPAEGLAWMVVAGLVGLALVRRRRLAGPLGVALAIGAASVIAASPAQAQPLSVGGKVGVDMAIVSGDNVVTAEFAPGMAVGATGRWRPFTYMALEADLLYALKGVGHQFSDRRTSMHYLTLPLTVQGVWPLGDITPRIYGGGLLEVLVSASAGDNDITDRINTLGWGVVGGVGIDAAAGPGAVTIDARYERGLRGIYDEEATPSYLSTPSNYHNVVYLLAGYLY